jgi:hypothetical protein
LKGNRCQRQASTVNICGKRHEQAYLSKADAKLRSQF